MKCQHCGVNDATIFYRVRVDGRDVERRLCADCAAALGYGGDWDGVLTILPVLLTPAARRTLRREDETPDDTPLLSEEETRALRAQRRRNALELRLREALEAEDYERAAELRDELRGLT